ncbi:MAG TPA: hypothetical protein VEC09_09920 [Actinomycetota bacterium]|jgi:hypothetical protein|nr:hypothetical protein [Actinomycetota bacterium]
MDIELDPLDTDVVAAMLAVVNGRPAMDVWLEFVRLRYPGATDVLARLALTDLALKLLVGRGAIGAREAAHQRREAAASAAAEVSFHTWQTIHRLRQTLGMLERYRPAEDDDDVAWVSDLSILDAPASHGRRAS